MNKCICKVDNCNKTVHGNGYCWVHNWRFKKYGDPLKLVLNSNKLKICSIIDCNRPYRCSGYCNKHYRRYRYHGDPLTPYRKLPTKCKCFSCEKIGYKRGYCNYHYYSCYYYPKNKKHISIKTSIYLKENPQILLNSHLKRIGKISKALLMNTIDYICANLAWSRSVKKRDNYTCQTCGSKKCLEAHHILHKIKYPQLSLNLNNGITLCRKCHLETHGKTKR